MIDDFMQSEFFLIICMERSMDCCFIVLCFDVLLTADDDDNFNHLNI